MYSLQSKCFFHAVGIVFILAGCSSKSSAPDFPNSWKSLNELPEQAVEIPLIRPYVFQVTQLDTTVKGLLERWGEEAKMPVIYDHSVDFTLFKQVKNIRQSDLQSALKELSKLYKDKGMIFYIQNGNIVAHKRADLTVNKNKKIKAK